MQQYVIFNALKKYCIPKEEEEEDNKLDWTQTGDEQTLVGAIQSWDFRWIGNPRQFVTQAR